MKVPTRTFSIGSLSRLGRYGVYSTVKYCILALEKIKACVLTSHHSGESMGGGGRGREGGGVVTCFKARHVDQYPHYRKGNKGRRIYLDVVESCILEHLTFSANVQAIISTSAPARFACGVKHAFRVLEGLR